jgi:hypothetical protein
MAMADPKVFLRCVVCAARRPKVVLVGGALGQPVLEALVQEFLGAGAGVDSDGNIPVGDDGRPLVGRARGGFRWTRRPLMRQELELLARAVSMAAERIARRLHGVLPDPDPAEVLAAVDDADLPAVAGNLLDEARAELTEREKLIDAELDRRGAGT